MQEMRTGINLFTSHFIQKDKERQKELDFCFHTNQTSGLFDEIINFDNRPTYNDFFKATREFPNDINVFANADIYFNETILEALNMGALDCYALTRHELNDKGEVVTFREAHTHNGEASPKHSQDVWIIRGSARQVHGAFNIGVPGCDNRIAYELFRGGYNVTNPCDRIQCIHKHAEKERNYTIKTRIPPPYLWVLEGNQGVQRPGTRYRQNI